MDFNTPADVAAMFTGASGSATETDRFDEANDDDESDDFEYSEIEVEKAKKISTSKIFLYPDRQNVEELRPEEIRWFYSNETTKKWVPFIGYDSLRLECRHRALNLNDGNDDDIDKDEKILVRGGLYDVDVKARMITPVYWEGKKTIFENLHKIY